MIFFLPVVSSISLGSQKAYWGKCGFDLRLDTGHTKERRSIPWAGGQGWEIEDTLVYLSGIAANITLQQDGRQHNEIFVDISAMRTYLLILKRELKRKVYSV